MRLFRCLMPTWLETFVLKHHSDIAVVLLKLCAIACSGEWSAGEDQNSTSKELHTRRVVIMPLTADDIAQVAAIVAHTMAQLQGTAGAAHGPKPQNVDERHFRKLATFGGGSRRIGHSSSSPPCVHQAVRHMQCYFMLRKNLLKLKIF